MLSQAISEFIPTAFILAQLTVCPIQAVPQVNIHFGQEKIHYNETMSSRELTEKMRGEKDSSLATHDGWAVAGLTHRMVDGGLRVMFKTLKDNAGNTCIYVDTATFYIMHYPAIFIAKEVTDLPCNYKVTKDHEKLHVAIDTITIEEYIPKLKVEVLQYLRMLGYAGFGPYTPENAKKRSDQLVKEINKASEPMAERLREAVRQRQGSIDTVESYMAEQAKCPEEIPEMSKRLSHAMKGQPPAANARKVAP